MLEIYQHDNAAAFTFRLVGTLDADSTKELELCWKSARSIIGERPIVVDVSRLERQDDSGAKLLARMRESGVQVTETAQQPGESGALGGRLARRIFSFVCTG